MEPTSSPQKVFKVVLLRHGESEWNSINKFTGWCDPGLSDQGVKEANEAGDLLKAQNYSFEVAYTSKLSRAIKTLWIVMEKIDALWLPVIRHWRLNERMYGGLQGLNKSETAEKHGAAQVKIWRRSYATPPPPVETSSKYYPGNDPRYNDVEKSLLPVTECLKDVVDRMLPYWKSNILPDILSGKKVLIAAHGNSLRALVKYLDNISDDEIANLNIPTGVPLVYELDQTGKALKHYYLGDQEAIAAAINKVKNQAKSKKST